MKTINKNHPIDWIEWPVKNVEAAVNWYGEHFGWICLNDEDANIDNDAIMSTGSGVHFHLYRSDNHAHRVTIPVFAIRDTNMEMKLSRISQDGGSIVQEPETKYEEWFSLFADPDGNVIKLWNDR